MTHTMLTELILDAFVNQSFRRNGKKCLRSSLTTKEAISVCKSRFSDDILIDALIWYTKFPESKPQPGKLDFHVSLRVNQCIPFWIPGSTRKITPEIFDDPLKTRELFTEVATNVDALFFQPLRQVENLAEVRLEPWASSGYFSPELLN